MAKPHHGEKAVDDGLAGKSIEELLLFIGDRDLGYAMAAMDTVVAMGFEVVYPVLEHGVRNDGNADLRNGAMEVLVRFGRESIPALVALLQDANEEVRNFAAVMLGDIGERDAVTPLMEALGDPDINVSHAAAEALGKIGDDAALLPLMRLLHGDFWLQYPAVVAMGAMADSRAVPHLIPLLDNDLLRETTIAALGKIGDRRALPVLVARLCDSRGISVAATAEAIAAIVEKHGGDTKVELSSTMDNHGIENLLGLISGDNGVGKDAAITLLGLVGEKAAIPTLLALLEEHDHEEAVKEAIMGMSSSVPFLGDELLSNSRKIQTVVLSLLHNLGFQVPTELLLSLFSQGTPEVRLEVLSSLVGAREPEVQTLVEALLEYGSTANPLTERAARVMAQFAPQQIQVLCGRLAASADPQKRAVAALIAGYAGTDLCTDVVLRLFTDQEACVRQQAVAAAGRWKKREFLPLLVAALSEEEPAVRKEALFSMVEYGKDMPVAQVLQHLGQRDEPLDYEIIMAVGRAGRTEAETALVAYLEGAVSSRLEFAVIETLGKIGSRTGPGWQILLRYLDHADPDIRRLAVEALAHLSGGGFIEEITAACKDEHWSVRTAALQGMAVSGSDRAIPVIAAALQDADVLVKKNAVSILAGTHNPLAMAELAGYLVDQELGRDVRDALFELGRLHRSLLHGMAASSKPVPVRQVIISIIGKFADEQSSKVLTALAQTDPLEEIRAAASYALILGDGLAKAEGGTARV